MRRGRALVAGAVLVGAFLTSSVAGAVPGPDQDAAEQAAREIQEARDQANEAAGEYAAAQTEFEQLTDRAAELAAENAALQAEVDALRVKVEQVAVNRFMASGSAGIPILTGYRQPNEQLQVDALVHIVTESSADAMDAYGEATRELEANQEAVADNQVELQEKQEEFLALQRRAEEEVVHLEEVESDRLEDEQVYLALLAQQREAQRQADEQRQRQEAEAASAAEARAASDRQVAEQAALRAPASESGSGSDSTPSPQLPAAPAPEGSSDDEPDPPASSGGGGGGGGGGGIICPVQGSMSYVDTYGAPRSGGRSHEGVDLMAGTGTPLVAVVSGSVQFKENRLGGLAVWLSGSDGNRYYYAHLSGFEGSSRGVAQGEVIGYVGATGNAPVPHLHFEVHPGGGSSVNPYPWVRNAGC